MVKKIARSLLTGTVLNGASALAIKFAAAIAGFAMFALSSRYMEPAPFIDFDATDFFLASAGALSVALALLDTTGQYLEVVVIGFFLGPTAAALIVGCRRLVGIDPSLGFALASTHIAQLKEETP